MTKAQDKLSHELKATCHQLKANLTNSRQVVIGSKGRLSQKLKANCPTNSRQIVP
ncbi:hypothetical protein DPMN_093631 [Dreissena polymorpha]|uniref:Uncharacterized protein n=1 Tax=Dreissena polymorpha TaxID=45954 RepID=A0A9D4L3A7_DREPO|nr:hypothetical protein DPMN_093631 [Dreissena polymorpha]